MSQCHHARAWTIGRSISALLAALLLAACSSGAQQASDQAAENGGSVSITLAGASGAGILPAFAAQQEGYFKQHGLNVKLETVTNPTSLAAGLGHQFQFIESYAPSVIGAAADGISISAVAGGEVTTPKVPIVATIVKRGSRITSFLQLQGERVGTPSVNGIIPVGLLALIKKEGGNPKSVHLVQVPSISQEAQLSSGRVDAILEALPFYSSILAQGYRSIGDPDLDLAGSSNHDAVLATLVAASRSWASQNPKIVSEFIAAINEADKWIAANSSAAKQLYAKTSGLPSGLVANAPLPQYKATVSANDVVPWVSYMRDAGDFSGQVNTNQLVFP